jgi:hypothetical protein
VLRVNNVTRGGADMCVCVRHTVQVERQAPGAVREAWPPGGPSVPEGRTYIEGSYYKTPQAAWLDALTR